MTTIEQYQDLQDTADEFSSIAEDLAGAAGRFKASCRRAGHAELASEFSEL